MDSNLIVDEKIIGRLLNESVIKTLGAYFDLRNSFTSHFECVWDKLNDISVKLQNIKFNQNNVIKHCNHFIIPKIAFGCVVIQADNIEIKKMQMHMEKMIAAITKLKTLLKRALKTKDLKTPNFKELQKTKTILMFLKSQTD